MAELIPGLGEEAKTQTPPAATPLPVSTQPTISDWSLLLSKEKCGICMRSLGLQSMLVIHPCKVTRAASAPHVFHEPCHAYVSAYFGGGSGCPTCAKELRAFPVGTDERDKEFFERATNLQWDFTQELIENPLDFGDCVYTHRVLGKRATFVHGQQESLGGAEDATIDSGGTTLLTPREVSEQVRKARDLDSVTYLRSRSELVSHLQHVFLADAALLSDRNAKGLDSDPVRLLGLHNTLASASSVTHALPGGAAPGQAGVFGMMKGVVRRALDMEDTVASTEESVMTSSSTTLLAGQSAKDAKHAPGTLRLIISRGEDAKSIFTKGFCAQQLITDGVTLAWMLRAGYTLDDLLVLRYDWELMLLAGLSADILRQFKATSLPVAGLAKYLNVGLLDVLESMCLGQVCTLTQCDFTYEEASLLFEVSKSIKGNAGHGTGPEYQGMAVLLYRWSGMTREDMAAFRWRLKDWHAAGLSLEQIKEMGIDDEFACTYLNWTPIEVTTFYRVPITELVPRQQPSQPMPQPSYPMQPSPAAISAAAASPIAPRPAPPQSVAPQPQQPQPQPRYGPPPSMTPQQQQQMYATARGAAPPMPRTQPPMGSPLSAPQRPTTLSSAPMRRILTPQQQQPLSSAPRLGPNSFSTAAGGGGLPGY